jgi:hypothetical protein
MKDYAFVHMARAKDVVEKIRGLDSTEFRDGMDVD